MRGKLKVLGLVATLSWLLLMPAAAGAVDAVMYETTEKAFLLAQDGTYTLDPMKAVARFGYAALEGTANFDSPFCAPLKAAGLLTGATCAVTAFGSTTIIFANMPPSGPVEADFETSINADNPADAPEFVIALGSISGTVTVDLSSAAALEALKKQKKAFLGPQIPILRMTGGQYTPPFGPSATFTATFRLPFAIDDEGQRQKPARGEKAFYLGDDGRKVRVDKNEFVLGFPMVRVEVTFDK